MPKFESQTMLVAVLRTFTGRLSPAYVSEQEFFLTSLNSMAKYLYDLQQATLRDICEGFLLKINSGKFTQEMITDFKTTVDSLISAADFRTVNSGMAGSREFIRRRLSALKPVSRVAEGYKPEGGDPDALRHIRDTYVRLNFDELAAQIKASPEEASINAAVVRRASLFPK